MNSLLSAPMVNLETRVSECPKLFHCVCAIQFDRTAASEISRTYSTFHDSFLGRFSLEMKHIDSYFIFSRQRQVSFA